MIALRQSSCAAALLLILTAPTWAAEYTVRVQQVSTPAGKPVHVGEFYTIWPNCTLAKTASFKVVQGPLHGRVASVRSQVVVNFVPPNPAANCHGRMVMSTNAVYTSKPGYVGQDFVEMEVDSHEGEPALVPVSITVTRP